MTWFMLIIVIILTRIPRVGKYLRLLNILVHEVGHALGTMVVRGKVKKIELYDDVWGITYSTVKGTLSAMVSTFSGYTFASMFSLLLMYLISKELYDVAMNLILGVVIISLILWIRNTYGFMWAMAYITITLVIRGFFSESLYHLYVKINVGIIYFEAFYIAVLLIAMWKFGEDTGDARAMSEHTGIPAGFWVIVFSLISTGVFIYGIGFWV